MVKSTPLLVTAGAVSLVLLLMITAASAGETGVQANEYPQAALDEYANASLMKKPPVAAFSGTPRFGPEPLNVQFTDESTGTITSYAWTFGDGNTSSLKNPSHRYTTAGSYTVTLTVMDSGKPDVEAFVQLVPPLFVA